MYQLSSQVSPLSGEKACSQRAEQAAGTIRAMAAVYD
jgi:hypothetical protein